MTGSGVLQAGCKARRLTPLHSVSQCSDWGCPLYIVTTGNWSPGVRIFQASLVFPESWGGYNSVSNKWNDLEMHSVVMKVFEIWHHSLERAHSGGTRVASFCAYGEKQLHQPCAVPWEGRRVWWEAIYLAVLESTQQSCKPATMTFLPMCEIMLYLSITL